MKVCAIGIGKGGNNILDSLLTQDATKGTSTLKGTIAVDSDKGDLMDLNNVIESQRLAVGEDDVVGFGTNSDRKLGAKIIEEDRMAIAGAADPVIGKVDAYLIISCIGGGMAGGTSEVINVCHTLDDKPVYTAVVLPHDEDLKINKLNAVVNFNNVFSSSTGTIVFNNEAHKTSSDDNNWLKDANETIASRLYEVLSTTDTDADTVTTSVFHDILNMDGAATIGSASNKIKTDLTGSFSSFLGDASQADPDEIISEAGPLFELAATQGVDLEFNQTEVSKILFLLSAPEPYLNPDAIRELKQKLKDKIPVDVVFETRASEDPSTIKATILFCDFVQCKEFQLLEQNYHNAYKGPKNGGSKPPFHLTSHTNSISAPNIGSSGRSSSSAKDGQGRGSHTDPDPPDVEGVDSPPELTFDDVVGLSDIKERIHEDVLLPAVDDRFDKYDIGSVTGVLFHGPPGTGKTYLAKATAGELGYNYIELAPSDITSKYVGEAAQNINDIFELACEAQPTLIFIDEIDSIAGDRGDTKGLSQSERGMINELLGELSDLNESDEDVIVIAATNTLDDVDSAIKRSGRFDTTIHIGPPDFETRYGILQAELEAGPPHELDIIEDDVLRSKTDGLVSSDMSEIAKSSLRKSLSDTHPEETPVVSESHILESVEEIVSKRQQDSSAAQMLEQPPDMCFDDVAGMDDLKNVLEERVIAPLQNPEEYEKYRLSTTNGVLLHGPPGTGKTYMSKAIAGELDFNFISITASDIVSKWIGEGTQNVGKLFATALDNQPALLFIDEIDAIASDRGDGTHMHQDQKQIVNEVLTGMSEVQGEDVVVFAATNLVSSLDKALTRSGRFDETIEVPPPDDVARIEILRHHLSDRPVDTDNIDWDAVEAVSQTDKHGNPFVASDIALIAETAARLALEENLDITQHHIEQAVAETESSYNPYE